MGPVRPGAAVPKARSGWGRSGHHRAVLIGGLVTVIIVGGAVAAWATVSSGSTGYQTASVTRADIGTNLTVVGNVEPVNDVAPSFQVGGQVATVTVAPGQAVTAGQTLATLDTTALSETVSSDQSALNADQAKLVEDEENESAASSASSAASSSGATSAGGTSKTTTPSSTTTTTVPSSSATASNATVIQDQTTLTQDEATLNTDQQKEAADLTQAQTECTSANTATPTGQATCEAGLQTVSADEQQVSKDQTMVSKDETALGQALTAASGGGSSSGGTGGTGRSGGTPGSSPTQTSAVLSSPTPDGVTLTAAITGNTGSGATAGSGATGGSGSTDTDTPEQIASDQADIDTAQAQLTEAQQSLNETTLTSPITGTVVSVGIDVGDTVSAGSSTEIITIIGTNSYEAQATLDSAQVPTVKAGQTTSVVVDGDNGSLAGTVAQVGPVQSSTSGYSYPVVVALPATAGNLHAGAAANLTISTGKVSNVVAVPTSAVQTTGSVSYVTELDKGTLTRKVIKIGMVGSEYTQVLSGLTPGQSVVLADYAEVVPSSNTETNTFGGLGGLGGGGGGFGGGGFGGGGGAFRARAVGGGGFGG